VKYVLTLILFYISTFFLWADNSLSVTMELYNALYQGEEEWLYAGTGTATLDVKAARNPNVQGTVAAEFLPIDLYESGSPSTETSLDLKKAYVKARFPVLRITVGKTRLSWGDGVVFNAGDLLFGSLNPLLDLTQQELRSDTAWLTAVNVPLGQFAFVEGVVLPPGIDQENAEAGELTKASIGGRTYFTLLNTKVELGYLYKGEEKVDYDVIGHRPYISLQGNIGPDWYMSSSAAFPTDAQKENGTEMDWKESWNISFGLFHLQEINRNNTLSLRLESLWFPYQSWDEETPRDTVYGVFLYPELTWQQGNSLTYSLQSVISPLDDSAMITGGAGWNIYQGLTLQAYLTFFAGEKSDTFAWDRGNAWQDDQDKVNGVSVMTGLRYTY
jgi:hypothetical protein